MDKLFILDPKWVSEVMQSGNLSLVAEVGQNEEQMIEFVRRMSETVLAVAIDMFGQEMIAGFDQPGNSNVEKISGLLQSLTKDQRKVMMLLIQSSFCFGLGYAYENGIRSVTKIRRQRHKRSDG